MSNSVVGAPVHTDELRALYLHRRFSESILEQAVGRKNHIVKSIRDNNLVYASLCRERAQALRLDGEDEIAVHTAGSIRHYRRERIGRGLIIGERQR